MQLSHAPRSLPSPYRTALDPRYKAVERAAGRTRRGGDCQSIEESLHRRFVRLKRTGMRWDDEGGQAILNFRALLNSNRFDTGWSLLAKTYRKDFELPHNVVKFQRN